MHCELQIMVLYLLVFVVFLPADPDWLQADRQWSLLQKTLCPSIAKKYPIACKVMLDLSLFHPRETNMHRNP